MLNKKLLAAAIALPMAFSGVAFGVDTAGDSHPIGVTVEAVAFLDIGKDTVTVDANDSTEYTALESVFTCDITVAAAAGSPIVCDAGTNVAIKYALTVNSASTLTGATPQAWILKARASDQLDPTWKLQVTAAPTALTNAAAAGTSASVGTPVVDQTLLRGATYVPVVNGIVNIATTDNTLTYKLGPVDNSVAMASGSGVAVVVEYLIATTL